MYIRQLLYMWIYISLFIYAKQRKYNKIFKLNITYILINSIYLNFQNVVNIKIGFIHCLKWMNQKWLFHILVNLNLYEIFINLLIFFINLLIYNCFKIKIKNE